MDSLDPQDPPKRKMPPCPSGHKMCQCHKTYLYDLENRCDDKKGTSWARCDRCTPQNRRAYVNWACCGWSFCESCPHIMCRLHTAMEFQRHACIACGKPWQPLLHVKPLPEQDTEPHQEPEPHKTAPTRKRKETPEPSEPGRPSVHMQLRASGRTQRWVQIRTRSPLHIHQLPHSCQVIELPDHDAASMTRYNADRLLTGRGLNLHKC